jgi:hypothetical protein
MVRRLDKKKVGADDVDVPYQQKNNGKSLIYVEKSLKSIIHIGNVIVYNL